MTVKGVIFDLDGVITDTAEHHYHAWQKLADEEGLLFNRYINEDLRGVSRRASLERIWAGQSVPEARLTEMMTRKNDYYVASLDSISPDDILPGVMDLLDELDEAGISYGLASASKNAQVVLSRLGLAGRFRTIADGHSVRRPKPAPDLFRYTAVQLGARPEQCVVVEDAAAGVQAALRGGMAVLAVGPAERFGTLLQLDGQVKRVSGMEEVTLALLQQTLRIDPLWQVTETAFEPHNLRHKETVFTIGNGYFSSRGSFEERYPGESYLTFVNGVFDDMPVAFTELVNFPRWFDTAVTVNQQPVRLDQGKIHAFSRQLDCERNVLRRHVRWEAEGGELLDMTFERFASYAQEHVGAVRLLITAVNQQCEVNIAVGVDGHVANQDLLHWTLQEQAQDSEAGMVWLQTRTRATEITAVTAMRLTDCSAEGALACETCPGQPRLLVAQTLEPGESLHLDRVAAIFTSLDVADPQQASTAVLTEPNLDYDTLKEAHVAALADIWHTNDVIIEGDDEAQLAARYYQLQLFNAAAQHNDRVSIAAKTLSGYGYRGHVFWDTEIYMLPLFTFTQPELARNLLLYRYHGLAGARQKAAANGYAGAQFPWESAASGEEVTPTWVPHFADRTRLTRIWTGDIQIHISADIAYAIMQYWQATGDDAFMIDYGAEIILDTARFWGSRAEREVRPDGTVQYALRNVIGPDEYHEHVDNNAFTNGIARWHLNTAVDVRDWLRDHAPEKAAALEAQLELDDSVYAHWQTVQTGLVFEQDRETKLIEQFEGFFALAKPAMDLFGQNGKSMQELLGIEGANAHQVLKQPDVVLFLWLFREQFDQSTFAANYNYYQPLTDTQFGSSLSPAVLAMTACKMGLAEEALAHFQIAIRTTLHNIRGNAGDGIHGANAGGVWQVLFFGFAGAELDERGEVHFAPVLPASWQRLAFKFALQDTWYQVEFVRQADGAVDITRTPLTTNNEEEGGGDFYA